MRGPRPTIRRCPKNDNGRRNIDKYVLLSIPYLWNTRAGGRRYRSVPPRCQQSLWNSSIVPGKPHYHVLHSQEAAAREGGRRPWHPRWRRPDSSFDMGWAQGWSLPGQGQRAARLTKHQSWAARPDQQRGGGGGAGSRHLSRTICPFFSGGSGRVRPVCTAVGVAELFYSSDQVLQWLQDGRRARFWQQKVLTVPLCLPACLSAVKERARMRNWIDRLGARARLHRQSVAALRSPGIHLLLVVALVFAVLFGVGIWAVAECKDEERQNQRWR